MLRLLRVPGSQGAVPLSAVAEISEGSGPARIDRLDRERNVTVTEAGEFSPPFDEVFVMLLEQEAARQAEGVHA